MKKTALRAMFVLSKPLPYMIREIQGEGVRKSLTSHEGNEGMKVIR